MHYETFCSIDWLWYYITTSFGFEFILEIIHVYRINMGYITPILLWCKLPSRPPSQNTRNSDWLYFACSSWAMPRLLYHANKIVFSGRLLLFARCQGRVHLHDDTPKLSLPEWLQMKTTSCDAYTIRTAITSHLLWYKKSIILNRIF